MASCFSVAAHTDVAQIILAVLTLLVRTKYSHPTENSNIGAAVINKTQFFLFGDYNLDQIIAQGKTYTTDMHIDFILRMNFSFCSD